MTDDDSALTTYLRLAVISQERKQQPGRDRFVFLAAGEAVKSGLNEVAQSLRAVLLSSQPRHLLAHYATVEEASHQEDVQTLFKQIRRLCPLEKAELLLARHVVDPGYESLPVVDRVNVLVGILEEN